jgi:hypothetical protein
MIQRNESDICCWDKSDSAIMMDWYADANHVLPGWIHAHMNIDYKQLARGEEGHAASPRLRVSAASQMGTRPSPSADICIPLKDLFPVLP